MSFRRALLATVCAVGLLAACGSGTPDASVDALLVRARETGRVLEKGVIPNSTVDGWYVFATPERPYPNAGGYMLQRDGMDGPVCVRQERVGSGEIGVIPAECPPAAGDANSTDAAFALYAALGRISYVLRTDAGSDLAGAAQRAQRELREEGHDLEITRAEESLFEVRLDGAYACQRTVDAVSEVVPGRCS